MTLKITVRSKDAERTRLRLEGRLRAADLAVLDACLEALDADTLELELADLHWLDAPAVERLSELVQDGAQIVAASPFVDRLLARGEGGRAIDPAAARRHTDAIE